MPKKNGRPQKATLRPVDEITRLAIGSECERLSREYQEKRAREVGRHRSKFLSAAQRIIQDAHERGVRHDPERIGKIFGNRSRHFVLPLKRPYGKRQKIIGTVARKYRASRRTVETCWAEFRRYNRELD